MNRPDRLTSSCRRWSAVLACAGILLTISTPSAIQSRVDLESIDEALRFVRTATDPERARFHRNYRVSAERAPLDYIEVVTPYRAIVLAGSARAAAGDRSFGQRLALELLKSTEGTLAIHAELTFHPFHAFVGIPAYTVTLTPASGGAAVPAREVTRLPRWTPRMEGLPLVPLPTLAPPAPPGTQLLGGTVVARFELAELDGEGDYDVLLLLEGEEVTRSRVGLRRLR